MQHKITYSFRPMARAAKRVARWAALVSALTACTRDSTDSSSGSARTADAAALLTRGQTFDLDGLQVQVRFSGFRPLSEQSDPSSGLLAFAAEHPSAERTASLFLDGSRSATLPTSAAEALASVLADDACKDAGACSELSHAALPNGGLLVSVRKPRAVYTEVWRKNAQARVVRCGAELSESGAASAAGKRWLDDAAAVRAARESCEALCRTVTPLP